MKCFYGVAREEVTFVQVKSIKSGHFTVNSPITTVRQNLSRPRQWHAPMVADLVGGLGTMPPWSPGRGLCWLVTHQLGRHPQATCPHGEFSV